MKRNLTLATSLFAVAAIFPGAILYLHCPEKPGLFLMFALLICGAGVLGIEIREQRKVIKQLTAVMSAMNQEHPDPYSRHSVPAGGNGWTERDLN